MKRVLKVRKIIHKFLLMIALAFFFVLPSFSANAESSVYNFDYTGGYQTFVVPRSGIYKLETWGAQGGYRTSSSMGGKGGYASGYVYLNRGDILYIYVGGSGETHQGWNGGGQQTTLNNYGGGATDIRFVAGEWNSDAGLLSRLIVAGGGGTDGSTSHAGGAGGLTGGSTSGCGTGGVGATLSAAGANAAGFGYGGNGYSGSGGHAGAGGGGWYGGGGASPDGSKDDDRGGGGGSSFTWNTQTESYVPTGYSVSEDYYMTGVSYSTGVRSGDGYATITAVELDGITTIQINRGEVPIDFSYDIYEYNLTVDNDVENIRFNIVAEDGYTVTQTARSTDMTSLLEVTNIITLTDSETGIIQIYTVNVRKQNSYLEDRDTVSYGYSYTGNYEKFYVPATGIYTLETWGAQGGHRGSNNGGKGGYSKADMYLVKGEVLYVYVGGSGNTVAQDGTTRGWNGGGHTVGSYSAGGVWSESTNMYGGGASDIRYGGNSLYNRVLVAGGGGSVGASGHAGGAAGVSAASGCGTGGTAATISAAGSYRAGFGYGGDGAIGSGGYGGAGGGGWYGGGGSNPDGSRDDDKGGGGGSGFAFTSEYSEYAPEGYLVTDKNYLTDATLSNGATAFTSPTGSSETGHSGDGYVRITPKLINGVSSITINDGEVPIDFDYTIYEYQISVLDSVNSITVNLQLNDGYSMTESHIGSYDITDLKEYVYSVDVVNDITGVTVNYTITFHKQSDYLMSGTTGSYGYSNIGLPQKFIAPAAGIYTLEVWGAQGGYRSDSSNGGKGGYSTGQIFLNKGQILYVYVGGSGNNGGYNGGGKAGYGSLYGGGASDIRYGGQSLYNRLIVAGGGGSVGASSHPGGYGGGTTAGSATSGCGTNGIGATLTVAGANNGTFGQGGDGAATNGGYSGAGGGGWYGGGGSYPDGSRDDDKGGGGGSGFVWTSDMTTIIPDEYLLSSSQYLSEASTVAGNTSFPSPTGGTETGHSGDGFVKISFSLSYDFEILVSDNVTLDKEFEYDEKDYVGTLDTNDSSLVTFTVTESDSILKVEGDGLQEIHVGDNTYNITITYINGAIEVFTYHIHREANDIDYLNNIYFDEHAISEFSDVAFDKDTFTYNVTLPYYMDEYDLKVDKGSADQIITNIGHIINKNNYYEIPISVTNETGTSTKTYTLKITLPHSSKIKKLTFNSSGGSVIEFPIEPGKTEFDVEFESHIAAVDTIVEMYDAEAVATVTGDGYILSNKYDITIVVDEPHVESTTYTFHVKRITVGGYEKSLGYTGNVQTVVIPYDHEYLLQVWGAQGGKGGGRGGYSYGNIYLEKGTILYVYTGGSGDNKGFNGGGTSKAGYGGGASDIRIGTDSLYSRVIVAGGGGGHGSDGCASGAVGGGLTGGGLLASGSCGTQAGGGSLTEGGTYGKYKTAIGTIGKFGIGANAPTSGGNYYGGGGGGGWYGGGSGATAGWSNGGGGGSGYVYTEEYASSAEGLSEWLLDSEYYLYDAATLSGSNYFVSPTDTYETGHPGNGYARISIPYQESENNYLDGIISNKGVMTPEWDYNVDTYYLELATDEVEINIEGVPADGKASVVGNGDYIIEAGTTEIELVVTAENGYTKTYTVIVTREADTNPNPKNILINGLIEEYCAMLDGACIYEFNVETDTYDVTVPYTIREIVMVVDKAHYFQTVNGDGLYGLYGGNNRFQIDVTSEDKLSTSSWYYNIYRDMTGNADLKVLRMTDPEYEINYSYNVTDYYVTVPHETENVEIEAIPDDENATVEITKPETLDYGQNAITIKVTAANGATKIYTLFVNRLESDNAFLQEFTMTNITDPDNPVEIELDSTFNKMNLKYTATVENDVTRVSLDGILEDSELASATGFGEYDLNVGANTLNVVVTAQDGSSLTYTFIVTRKANSNTLLSHLALDEANLTETFEPTKFTYYVYVTGEVESLTITATPQVSTSTYKIIGNYTNLIAGKNEITIRVTAEDGSTCDYKLIVNRTGYADNYLQTLLVTNGSEIFPLTPNFDPLYETYTLDLPNEITNVLLTATADQTKRAKIGNSSVYTKNINLLTENPSNNVITVTAEDGTTRTYTLVINREKSSDNTLASLEVENNTLIPDFDPDTLEYSFTTNDRSLNITAVPNNQFADVVISSNAKSLAAGDNRITIDVTSETGETRTYVINVTRVLSDDNTLKTLEISKVTLVPDFDPEVVDYSFDTFEEKLNITAIANNKYATVVISNPSVLLEGNNTIEIVVTSESGLVRTYTIIANRLLDDNNYLASLTTNTGLEPEFDKETLEYTKTTEETTLSINVTLESGYATYVITDSEGNAISNFPTNLALGENTFFINVTAQNGDVRTYELNITRNQSSDSKLSNLTTDLGLNETFDPETYQYTVNTSEHEITITPTVRNKFASYVIYDMNGDEVGSTNTLITGTNMYMIIVTAENGTTSTYSLVVTRTPKNIATIDELGIEVSPNFDKNTFDYTITTDETSLNLENIILTDPYSTYVINGNSGFTNDATSTVTIVVTSEDGTVTNTYTLEVTKIISTDARLGIFELDDYEFVPEFDKDTNTYEVFVPTSLSSANLNIKTLKNTAVLKSITLDGVELVTDLSNIYNDTITISSVLDQPEVVVTVQAEDGTEATYNLTISSEDLINNYLSTLNVSCGDLDPVFDRDTNSYVVFVDETVTSCTVLATPEVDIATVTGTGEHSFPAGDKYLTVPVTVTSARGEDRVYTVKIRRPLSNEARLESLDLDNNLFDPVFSSDTFEYNITVPNSIAVLNKDVFTYTTIDPDSVVTFPEMALSTKAVNKYTITSVSEDGSITVQYVLNITREKSSSTEISSVIVSVGNDNFICVMDQTTRRCQVTVPSDTTDFKINANLPEGATVSPENPSSHTIDSTLYNKEVELAVTAEDGTEGSYIVEIIRGLSSNNNLMGIEINSIPISNFSSTIYTYDKTVLGTTSQALITVTLADSKSTVITDLSQPFTLDYGVNTIEIVVQAEDKSERTYTLNIKRSDATDATLTSLAVKDYPFEELFDPEETTYTVRVPRTKTTLTKSEIIYTLSDPDAIISMPSKIDIDFSKANNIYSLTVTAGDGMVQKTYNISVLPELATNNNITSIVIDDNEITHVDKVFNYDIFDTDTNATLTTINLENEYATHTSLLPYTLTYGTPYTIIATAENGDVANYTVNLVKTKTRELKLANIEAFFENTDDCEGICTFDKTFDEDTTNYEIYVPNEMTWLENLVVTTKNDLQTYEIIGNNSFKVGENTVIIRVKNSLDETFDYTLTVYREANADPNLADLSFLVPEYDIVDFDENLYEYNVEFNGIASGKYELNYLKKNSNQEVTISGDKVLYFGRNDIIVHVQSESCFTDVKTRAGCNEIDYIIHAYRNEAYSNLLDSLTVSSGNVGDFLQVFNKYKFDYVLEVDSEVSKVKIEGTAVDTDHTEVTGNGDYDLVTGLNTVYITVTPEIGDPATYTLNIVRRKNDNVNLENLWVVDYELSPEFSKNVLDYYIEVDSTVTSLDIRYTKETEETTVHITGNSNFVTGENIVNVVVLSGDKTRGKTYRIHVTKNPSDNNLLSNIIVSSDIGGINTTHPLNPSFDSETNNYTVTVGKDVSEVNINAIKGQVMQTITGAGDYALEYGENIITLTVTSESGIVNNYEIIVNREFDFGLNSLTVSHDDTYYDLDPEYSDDVFEYTVDVPYEVDSVVVDATLKQALNEIEGLGEYELNTGINDITITVSYLEKGEVDYIIHINRAKNNDNTLLSLQVAEGLIDPIFDSSILEYSVNIPYEFDSATVIYETTDPNATVEILNNTGLEIEVTQDIEVIVTAENGETQTYIIHATRLPMPAASNRLTDMYIDEGTLDPLFNIGIMNYTTEIGKDVKRINLHIKAEEYLYSTVEVYKLGSTSTSTVDMTVEDPKIMLSVDVGKNTFIIRVTNYEGSVRNYQLDVYRAGPNEARIKSLSFDYGTLSPTFDRNKNAYTMEVDNTVTTITEVVTMMDEAATYTISGNKNLKMGENTVIITTLAQDGKTSLQYTIIVTKKASSNAYLSDIATFPEKDFEFDKEKYNYVFNVADTVNTIQIIGIREDTTAKITGNGIYTLTESTTTIKLTVTAEDGVTTKVYTVVVNKAKNNNANLQSLTINNGTLVPEFDKDTTDYTVEVENVVDSITLTGLPEVDTSSVTGNGSYNLNVGENKLPIVVTAEDGTIKTYFVTVTRKENQIAQTLLDDMKVVEGELVPDFSPETTDYVVNIPNEYDTATIVYTPHNPDAIVDIYDNTDLVVGHNIITVKVSYDGLGTTYTIDAIRQEASNTYLNALSVSGHEISPEFDKTIQNYTLDVDSSVTEISLKATAELATSTVYVRNGTDYVLLEDTATLSLNPGVNKIYIKVVSVSKAERVYQLEVTRSNSDENKLLTLTTSVGTLDPKFDPDTNTYTLNVPVGTKYVTLSGTVSDYATVTGLETYPVTVGSYTRFITVTSQSGLVNTYEVTIVREASSDATITNIVPSVGTLDPTFTQGTSKYTMEVEGDEDNISFDVTTASTDAVVAGDGVSQLFAGKNIITITAIAEDGITQESVTIEIYKKTDIISFEIDDEIDVPVGNDYQLEIKYNPENTDYKGMSYVVADSSILTIDSNGLITPIKVGDTTITVTSTRNTSLTKTVTIHVINPEIESDVYIINRDLEGSEYIIGMEPKITVDEFLSNLKNERETLKVYDAEDANTVDEDGIIMTKYRVKLIINNTVYDELVLVIKGDVNGDGYVTVGDVTKIKNSVLRIYTFDYFEKAASDINMDDNITVGDVTKTKNYVLRLETSLNTDLYNKVNNE